jgi:hypothetical protein
MIYAGLPSLLPRQELFSNYMRAHVQIGICHLANLAPDRICMPVDVDPHILTGIFPGSFGAWA